MDIFFVLPATAIIVCLIGFVVYLQKKLRSELATYKKVIASMEERNSNLVRETLEKNSNLEKLEKELGDEKFKYHAATDLMERLLQAHRDLAMGIAPKYRLKYVKGEIENIDKQYKHNIVRIENARYRLADEEEL